ncbi:MAG: hypothetical protein ACKOBR_05445, partial [Actinomycetota bacterium]
MITTAPQAITPQPITPQPTTPQPTTPQPTTPQPTALPTVREISDAQVQATVATLPANVRDLSLPVFVNNQLPEPQAAAPLMIQTQAEVTVQVVTVNEQVVTVSDETGFRFAIAAVDDAGEPIRIAADGALSVRRDHWISIVGSGLLPNSTAVAWVFS